MATAERQKAGRSRRRFAETPRLVWLPLALAGTVTTALALGAALYVLLVWLAGLNPWRRAPLGGDADELKLLVEIVKVALGIAAAGGAVLALTIGYRRHRIEVSQSYRDDERLFTDRFESAAKLIGDDKAAVRLSGVYAMAQLADDWEPQRQTCIDVLCAYIRMPYSPAGTRWTTPPSPGETEVRQTVLRVIGSRLSATPGWQGLNFDFTGAVIDGADFRAARFSGGQVSFAGAEFSGGHVDFSDAVFSGGEVSFYKARFSGGVLYFDGAEFSGGRVSLNGARLSAGKVSFTGAEFSGSVLAFPEAEITGGLVYFDGAGFSGGRVFFSGAVFSGGEVSFTGAGFSGGEVSFYEAEFSGGKVSFIEAKFSGAGVSFDEAVFSRGDVSFLAAAFSGGDVSFFGTGFSGGEVSFNGAEFSGGKVSFLGAGFSGGEVSFTGAAISGGEVSFYKAGFSGAVVSFDRARFSGGEVSFREVAVWAQPPTGIGPPAPPGVELPEAPSES